MAASDDDLEQHTSARPMPVLAAQKFSRSHALQQVGGPLAPRIIELDGDELVVGRNPDVQLCIPSSALSRRHAMLQRCPSGFLVVDLDSSNGLYLNELRIHSAELRDGDTIQVGNVVFIYHEGR